MKLLWCIAYILTVCDVTAGMEILLGNPASDRLMEEISRPLAIPRYHAAPLYPHSRPELAPDSSFTIATSPTPQWAMKVSTGSLAFDPTTLYRPESIGIWTERGTLSISCKTGRVTFPPGTDLDDASRRFWQAIERTVPRWQP